MEFNYADDVIEDPEGAALAIRRARNEIFAAGEKLKAFELVFAAFDELRMTGYVPVAYSPRWRERAEAAEADAGYLRETVAYIDYTLGLPMFQNAISEYGKGVVETLGSIRHLLTGGMHPDMRARLAESKGEGI